MKELKTRGSIAFAGSPANMGDVDAVLKGSDQKEKEVRRLSLSIKKKKKKKILSSDGDQGVDVRGALFSVRMTDTGGGK